MFLVIILIIKELNYLINEKFLNHINKVINMNNKYINISSKMKLKIRYLFLNMINLLIKMNFKFDFNIIMREIINFINILNRYKFINYTI